LATFANGLTDTLYGRGGGEGGVTARARGATEVDFLAV